MCLYHAATYVLAEDAQRVLLALCRKRLYVFEAVVNAEFLVFECAHHVIRQNLHALHHRVLRHVGGKGVQPLVVVGIARHHYVPDPRGLAYGLEVVEHSLVVGARRANVGLVQRVVECFNVEQHEIGFFERGLDLLVEDRTRGVERGVESALAAQAEELGEKLCLHQRFAAGARHAAAADEVLVFLHLRKQLFGRQFILYGAIDVPRVGIVTKGTTQRTALEKGYKPYSGAVHCAKGFDAVQSSFHKDIFSKRVDE